MPLMAADLTFHVEHRLCLTLQSLTKIANCRRGDFPSGFLYATVLCNGSRALWYAVSPEKVTREQTWTAHRGV